MCGSRSDRNDQTMPPKKDTKTMEEYEVLVRQKKAVESRLSRVQRALLDSEENPNPNLQNIHFLQLNLQTVECCYRQFNELQNSMYALPLSDETRDAQEEEIVVFETAYNDLIIHLNSMIAPIIKEETRAVVPAVPLIPAFPTAATQSQLPPLKVPLPQFDGSYENWLSFKCMFQTIMGRYKHESPAIKLYHLRNSLTGKAAGIIDQDIINNNDYDAAWEMLTERFEDLRLIIDRHIEALNRMPRVTKESAVELRKLVDNCTKNVDALKNLDLPVAGLGEAMLINLISSKMDPGTRKDWETNQVAGALPQYGATMNFMKERCKVLEKISINTKTDADTVKPPRSVAKSHTLATMAGQKCSVCKNEHELWRCDDFKKISVSEKYDILRKSGSCYNCLQRGHRTNECPSSSSCKKCGKRHHTFLHPEERKTVTAKTSDVDTKVGNRADEAQAQSVPAVPNQTETGRVETTSTLCSRDHAAKNHCLLSTAVVTAYGSTGLPFPCRALLDSASQTHFVTEQFADCLALRKESADYLVSGLDGKNTKIRFKIQLKIKSRVTSYSIILDCLVVPKIIGDLPVQCPDVSNWPFPSGIELADPTFFKKNRIDILIGADVFWDLLRPNRLKLAPDLPTITDTELGWIVGGSFHTSEKQHQRTLCTVIENENLGDLLNRFWEIEGLDDHQQSTTTMNEECLEHFQRTFQRDEQGRFHVSLPFNERKNEIGESKEIAIRRFLNLERKLDKDHKLKQQYSDFIHEYLQSGHMREIDPADDEEGAFYLPHHCVFKPSSTTTKLRVVFDGSARSSTGVSINDALIAGPTVQNDLVAILMNFRCFRYVVTVDVPKMFRQIGLQKPDRKYVRIVWRDDSDQPLKVFELQTVTYGLASSPFLATMALKQLAIEHAEEYPLAAAAVEKCFYMDDALAGAQTLEEACQLQRELTELLQRGCFGAHKWCSNSDVILEDVPDELRGDGLNVADIDSKSIVKTLGVAWSPKEDWFSFCVSPRELDPKLPLTRRNVLSEVARIYDPLGLIGPVLTTAKLFLREIAAITTEWDEPLPEAIVKRWRLFREDLSKLNDLKIPRWILSTTAINVELHGFADSSKQAYGACLYTRMLQSDGTIVMNLICSKSRILPKSSSQSKPITTPRSELLAAVLLSRLTDKFLSSTETKFAAVRLWSDSQIVLSWLRKSPGELQLFVSNRVKEVQKLTKDFQWRHVDTHSNPADIISRGEQPGMLIRKQLWWNGPCSMPISMDPEIAPALPDTVLPELKKGVSLAVTNYERMKVLDDVSDFAKLQRYMAYLIRFALFIASKQQTVIKGPLDAAELLRAQKLIVRLVQAETFSNEIAALKRGDNERHRLRNLHPFIDAEDEILRVGGRIKHAFIPFDSRHQMLLPAKHPVTENLIRHLHIENLHLGQRALLAVVRQRFWPLNAKSTIRKVIRSCTTCFRADPTKTTQLMGNLPSYRVQPAPTFARTGIDFAGPFSIKSTTQARRPLTTKGYVCLFVCMSTRAIHIELVSDLTSDAFLAALRSFVSRRGLTSTIFSDNATNFVGANGELEELRRLFENEQHQKQLNEFCSSKGIEWRFIPPRSPHFGGIWEAGVKSIKHHLKRIVGTRRLTFEELYTTLTQIEAVLNSRPLTEASDDPSDLTAITPAHFLIGRAMQTVPEPSYLNLKESTLSKWQLVQCMQQQFWKRWTSEYLPELQIRQKWYRLTKIKPGALVLLIDKNAPPAQWLLARIITLHTGQDDVTRVVTVKTSRGEFKRAVTEICLLPLDEDQQQDRKEIL